MNVKRNDRTADLQDRITTAVESGRVLARANSGSGAYRVMFVLPTGGVAHRIFDHVGMATKGYAQSFAEFTVCGKPSAFVERVSRTLHDARAHKFDVRIHQIKQIGVRL